MYEYAGAHAVQQYVRTHLFKHTQIKQITHVNTVFGNIYINGGRILWTQVDNDNVGYTILVTNDVCLCIAAYH